MTWTVTFAKHLFLPGVAKVSTERFSLEFEGSEEEAVAYGRELSTLLRKSVDGKPLVHVISGEISIPIGNP